MAPAGCNERHRVLRYWLAGIASAGLVIALSVAGVLYAKSNGNTEKIQTVEIEQARISQKVDDSFRRIERDYLKELLKEAKK